MNKKELKIFICAGEVSGEMHGALLMRALKSASNIPIHFKGFGGDNMRAEGAEILYHTDQTAAIGITPVIKKFPFFYRMAKHLKREILDWKPDLVLTIDYTGMNLRLAKFAHDHGFKTSHYVCPQVWAWHRGRIPKIAAYLDQLLCFFPFEPELFKDTPLRPEFIGHPLVDEVARTFSEPRPALPWKGKHHIAILPGSRISEILYLLPRMLESAVLLEAKLDGDCSFVIPTPTKKMREYGEQVAATVPRLPKNLTFVNGHARHVLLQAHTAIVASGTATLEACMMKCPTVLVYASNAFTAWAARRLLTGITCLGLANIVAGREVMPELLQDDFIPERAAHLLHRYLTDEQLRASTIQAYEETTHLLGEGNAVANATDAILNLLSSDRSFTK
ncbi:MAG: lipid-A-disaccharide synthase [bacterium]